MNLKLLQKAVQKTAQANVDLIGNKIAEKITKVLKIWKKTLKAKQKILRFLQKYQEVDT